MLIGVFSAIVCILVGFFPMNFLEPHYLAAMTFFIGAMEIILLFSFAIIIQKEAKIPNLFVIPGLVLFGIYLALTTIDFSTIEDYLDLETGGIINRPEIWNLVIIEWTAVLSGTAYLLLISLYTYLKSKK